VCDQQTDNVGKEITGLDIAFNSMNNNEVGFAKKDDNLKQDMADMLEYVRMLTEQIVELRKRTRAA
jgi:hypothetical protein